MADVRALLEEAYTKRGDATAARPALASVVRVLASAVRSCGCEGDGFMAAVVALVHEKRAMAWCAHCLSFLNELLLSCRATLLAAIEAASAGRGVDGPDVWAAVAMRTHVLGAMPGLLKAVHHCWAQSQAADSMTAGVLAAVDHCEGSQRDSSTNQQSAALLLIHLWHESGLLFPCPGEQQLLALAQQGGSGQCPPPPAPAPSSLAAFADPMQAPVGMVADRLKLAATLPPQVCPAPAIVTPLDAPGMDAALRAAAARAPRVEAGRFPARLSDFCRKAEALEAWCQAGGGEA